jgi:hypothetical protein
MSMSVRNTKIKFIALGSPTAAPLLYPYIAAHPDAMLTNTVTQFFSDASIFARGVSWYEGQFISRKSGRVYGELALEYLANSQAAGLIARTYPNAKLLAIIEDPLVSVRVEYMAARQRGGGALKLSLGEWLDRNPEVLLRSRYGRQLVHYFSYYGVTDLLVVCTKDVQADPLRVVKNVYTHLGLDSEFVPAELRHLVVIEDDGKKPGLIKRMRLFIKKIVTKVAQGIYRFIHRPAPKTETLVQRAAKIPLSPELEAKLKNYFKADVAQLSSLLHRNLSVEWGYVENPD